MVNQSRSGSLLLGVSSCDPFGCSSPSNRNPRQVVQATTKGCEHDELLRLPITGLHSRDYVHPNVFPAATDFAMELIKLGSLFFGSNVSVDLHLASHPNFRVVSEVALLPGKNFSTARRLRDPTRMILLRFKTLGYSLELRRWLRYEKALIPRKKFTPPSRNLLCRPPP